MDIFLGVSHASGVGLFICSDPVYGTWNDSSVPGRSPCVYHLIYSQESVVARKLWSDSIFPPSISDNYCYHHHYYYSAGIGHSASCTRGEGSAAEFHPQASSSTLFECARVVLINPSAGQLHLAMGGCASKSQAILKECEKFIFGDRD